jgi:predicted RND superfamily exporter protein
VSFVPRNELNDEFIKYFDETVDFRSATEFTTANLTGLYTVDYSLGNGETGGINEPDFLHDVERFAEWFRAQENVLHVTTLTDIMRRLNMNMHGDDPDWYRLPEERELAAQYLLLYEMSLPYGLDLNNQIDISKSATKMTVFLESLSSNELLAMEGRAQQWLADNAPHMQSGGASPSVMFAYIGQRNIRSMLVGTSIALVLISLILIFALRSLKIGLLSLIPNMAPAAMGFGLWGLLYGQVGLGLSIVAGLTLGIVVDDTVHFLSKYLRARREQGMSSEDAVRYAFNTVGVALLVTTIVLVAGFLVLAQSAFKLNSDMGLLTSITIAFALLADFLFLPPLLMKIDKEYRLAFTLADFLDGILLFHHCRCNQGIALELPVGQFIDCRGHHFNELVEITLIVAIVMRSQSAHFELDPETVVVPHPLNGIPVLLIILAGHGYDFRAMDNHLDIHKLRRHTVGFIQQRVHQ